MLGAFVTLASCLRLWQLVLTRKGEEVESGAFDPTWMLVGPAVWSVIETNLSIVCACLPSMRPLLRLVMKGNLRSGQAYGGSSSAHTRQKRKSSGMWTAPSQSEWMDPDAKRTSFLKAWKRASSVQEVAVPLMERPSHSQTNMKMNADERVADSEWRSVGHMPARPSPLARSMIGTRSNEGSVSGKNWMDAGSERASDYGESEYGSVKEYESVTTTRIPSPLATRRERPASPTLLRKPNPAQTFR
jgi:hypothetical protein